ncbi:hypothetical protein TeGR_g7835 [Tetraparma gracilis]|uniref:Uncharacterized protein n=1 Tax=Tetraparma gracilis TaxID=2962635 RepID=A0ABQ6MXD0_9STRA|nr:hypothetical protein TeGR_g7835 [Tetraparma gracilis]
MSLPTPLRLGLANLTFWLIIVTYQPMDFALARLNSSLSLSLSRSSPSLSAYRWALLLSVTLYGLLSTRLSAALSVVYLAHRLNLVAVPLPAALDPAELLGPDAPPLALEAISLAALAGFLIFSGGSGPPPRSRMKGKPYDRRAFDDVPAETAPAASAADLRTSPARSAAHVVSPGSDEGESALQSARREAREGVERRAEERLHQRRGGGGR